MFKRIIAAAALAAVAIIVTPAASEAGTRAAKGEARSSCGLTKMFTRSSHRANRDRSHRHAHRAHRARTHKR
mgnify:CR=1 FL=1